MKKKLALVTIRKEIGNMYYSELESLFSDYFQIVSYSLETDHINPIGINILSSVDILIITNPNTFTIVKNYVKNDCKVKIGRASCRERV